MSSSQMVFDIPAYFSSFPPGLSTLRLYIYFPLFHSSTMLTTVRSLGPRTEYFWKFEVGDLALQRRFWYLAWTEEMMPGFATNSKVYIINKLLYYTTSLSMRVPQWYKKASPPATREAWFHGMELRL